MTLRVGDRVRFCKAYLDNLSCGLSDHWSARETGARIGTFQGRSVFSARAVVLFDGDARPAVVSFGHLRPAGANRVQ